MLTCGSHFDWLWQQLSEQEQILLAMISDLDNEDGKSLTLADLESRYRYYRLPYEREHLQMCLKSLADADIIAFASEDQFTSSLFSIRVRIPVGLMRKWLRRERPAHLLLGFQAGRF
jgi:hypothetical protein